jgi:hypothetical protein
MIILHLFPSPLARHKHCGGDRGRCCTWYSRWRQCKHSGTTSKSTTLCDSDFGSAYVNAFLNKTRITSAYTFDRNCITFGRVTRSLSRGSNKVNSPPQSSSSKAGSGGNTGPQILQRSSPLRFSLLFYLPFPLRVAFCSGMITGNSCCANSSLPTWLSITYPTNIA